MQNTQTQRHFTPEEYETVSERVEIKVEYLDGQIVPKEGLDPLPEWVVEEILSPNFSLSTLNFEFPMATKKHARLISNITRELNFVLDQDDFIVYGQDPEIFISLSGKYRIPDVSVTPEEKACEWHGEKLTNPIVVMEILSPSNERDEFSKKLLDYKSLESLQEYWLISQDTQILNRFVRSKEDKDEWLNKTYTEKHEEVEFPSLGVKLRTKKIYKGVIFEKE
jgi:Uma2 family endonuclease